MANTIQRRTGMGIHPVHAIVLASTIPLFLGAFLSDWGYAESYEIQWTNFASWLVAGGLVFAGLALVFAIVGLLRGDARGGSRWLYPGLLLATFLIGLWNALEHAKDAWAAMPQGLILSAITLLLAIAANWAAYRDHRIGDDRTGEEG